MAVPAIVDGAILGATIAVVALSTIGGTTKGKTFFTTLAVAVVFISVYGNAYHAYQGAGNVEQLVAAASSAGSCGWLPSWRCHGEHRGRERVVPRTRFGYWSPGGVLYRTAKKSIGGAQPVVDHVIHSMAREGEPVSDRWNDDARHRQQDALERR